MIHARLRGGLRLLLPLVAFLLAASWSTTARAYAWMIRHEYAGCNQCHADPSGGSLLTLYGRAQAELLLRTRYWEKEEEPGKIANFLFGAFTLPDSVLLGGDVRGAYFSSRTPGSPANNQLMLMQSDLEGQATVNRFRANVSIGYAHAGDLPDSITSKPQDNLITRVFWLGADLGADREFTVRAGRMNLPFGIRAVEHTMWIRQLATRTDIDTGQQYGAALAYNGNNLRGEAMLIAGNFQVSPDAYRDRGYSGYLEWSPANRLGLGASSMIVHAERDIVQQQPLYRQAHGLFARYAPVTPLVLMAEGDFLFQSSPQVHSTPGAAAMFQADVEPIQGVHVIGIAEAYDPDASAGPPEYEGWGGLVWFFAPHADIRGDAVYQSLPSGGTRTSTVILLGQLHVFL